MKLWEENGYLFIDGTDAEKVAVFRVIFEEFEDDEKEVYMPEFP